MEKTVSVWDPVVRTFHWLLVLAIVVQWISADRFDEVHETNGLVIAALVALRVAWGFLGSHYAKFTQFVRGPGRVTNYLRDMAKGQETRHIGHNPVGAVMILMLLLSLAVQALSGWMQTTDRFWGVGWVQTLHNTNATILMILIIGHIAGVVLASYRHRENLARAMLTGRKRAPANDDVR